MVPVLCDFVTNLSLVPWANNATSSPDIYWQPGSMDNPVCFPLNISKEKIKHGECMKLCWLINLTGGSFWMEYNKLKLWSHSVILTFHGHSFWEGTIGGLQHAKEFVCKHLSHCRFPWHSHLWVKCACPCIQVLFHRWETNTTDKCMLMVQARRWHIHCLLPLASQCIWWCQGSDLSWKGPDGCITWKAVFEGYFWSLKVLILSVLPE